MAKGYSPNIKKSRLELIKEVMRLTSQANQKIASYRETGRTDIAVENEIRTLQEYGSKYRGMVGTGLRGKTKAELLRQVRELEYFNQWDIDSIEGQRQLEQREIKAYEEYKARYGDIDYEDWRDLVEIFGTFGKTIINQFGSSNLRKLNESYTGDKRNLIKGMQKVLKQSRGKGWYQEDMIDHLYDLLGEENFDDIEV